MLHQFDHRFGDYATVPEGKSAHRLPRVRAEQVVDPRYVPQPRYWVPAKDVDERLSGKWTRGWLLGWRDITDSRASARTVVSAAIPCVGVGHKYLLMLPTADPANNAALLGNLNSLALDYVARQKVAGLSLTYFTMKQLPLLPPDTYQKDAPWHAGTALARWIGEHVLELTYTSWDLAAFARDLGHDGPPFRWDQKRRPLLRAELDAAFFHLYGVSRTDTAYILGTFAGLAADEDDAPGQAMSTVHLILEIYDAMQKAIDTARPYRTLLDPPPADPGIAHLPH